MGKFSEKIGQVADDAERLADALGKVSGDAVSGGGGGGAAPTGSSPVIQYTINVGDSAVRGVGSGRSGAGGGVGSGTGGMLRDMSGNDLLQLIFSEVKRIGGSNSSLLMRAEKG